MARVKDKKGKFIAGNATWTIDDAIVRRCTSCSEVKNINLYYNRGADLYGKQRKCKVCINNTSKIWYDKNPDKAIVYHRKAVYSLSDVDFQLMLVEQNNSCICGKEFTGTPHVDHCHSSGKVRGLLCTKCNRALGLVHDNTETLKALIRYLEKSGE